MSKVNVLFFGQLIKISNAKNYEFSFGKKQISVAEFRKQLISVFPELEKYKFAIAVNKSIFRNSSLIKNGDEVALLPPISGGNISYLTKRKITKKFINQIMRTTNNSCGSILTFEGIVRADKSKNNAAVEYINYTAYAAMAEKEIGKIVNVSIKRFGLIDIVVKHRLGKVKLNEIAFFVAVFSSHRKEGIKAIDFIIDSVKKTVPIWKEELFSDGSYNFKAGKLIS